MVTFSEEGDYHHALLERPWLILDHYLLVQRWRPFFRPCQPTAKKIAAWVRIQASQSSFVTMISYGGWGHSLEQCWKWITTRPFTLMGSLHAYALKLISVFSWFLPLRSWVVNSNWNIRAYTWSALVVRGMDTNKKHAHRLSALENNQKLAPSFPPPRLWRSQHTRLNPNQLGLTT